MPKKVEAPKKAPDLPKDKAYQLLKTQLGELGAFKGKRYDEVGVREEKWQDFTRTLIARTFGDPSDRLSDFYQARHAGSHNIMGISNAQRQSNFNERIVRFEAVLENCLAELQIDLPDQVEGVYPPGKEYEFYRDLAAIIAGAQRVVLIVDPFLDAEHFNLYMDGVRAGVEVQILGSAAKNGSRQPALTTAVSKFKASGRKIEMRDSDDLHDRVILKDDRAWVSGQSFKDAASTKPTYIVEVDADKTRSCYEPIWKAARLIV